MITLYKKELNKCKLDTFEGSQGLHRRKGLHLISNRIFNRLIDLKKQKTFPSKYPKKNISYLKNIDNVDLEEQYLFTECTLLSFYIKFFRARIRKRTRKEEEE
ncbi:UNVERIFIED_CONTAM: hypothetical protein FKN15_057122 [Acipenser sinensis]